MEFIHEKIDMGYDDLDRAEHADGRRYVTLDGNAYPSVTTVLSIINEEKIAAWRQKVGEEKANQIGTQAANRGTLVHEIIEKYLHNEDTSDYLPHIQQSLKNLKPLLDKHITKVYATECPLYSDYLKLAGTCDCIAEWHGVPSFIFFPPFFQLFYMTSHFWSIFPKLTIALSTTKLALNRSWVWYATNYE